MGNSSGVAWTTSRSSCACTSSPPSVGCPRAGARGGGSRRSPTCVRIFLIGAGWVMTMMRWISQAESGSIPGHTSTAEIASSLQSGSHRRTAEDVSLGPHRYERPRGVLEHPDARLADGLRGGVRRKSARAVRPRTSGTPVVRLRPEVGRGGWDIVPTVQLRLGGRRASAGERSRPESRDGLP